MSEVSDAAQRGRRERGKAELSVLQEASTSQRASEASTAGEAGKSGDASMQLRVLLETSTVRPRQKRFKDSMRARGTKALPPERQARGASAERGCQAVCFLLEASTSEASAPREA
jgi:hypothetical protein